MESHESHLSLSGGGEAVEVGALAWVSRAAAPSLVSHVQAAPAETGLPLRSAVLSPQDSQSVCGLHRDVFYISYKALTIQSTEQHRTLK